MSEGCKDSVTRADLDREVQRLREIISHLRELLVEREKQLVLQAKEYERRLEELNNSHARAEKAAQLTVPRDMYDAYVNQQYAWKQEVATQFATLKAVSTANTRFFTILTVLLSLAFSAVSIWLRNK